MAQLVKEFQNNSKDFETIVCVTSLHREMLDQVFQIFDITPNYDLNFMKQGQDLRYANLLWLLMSTQQQG